MKKKILGSMILGLTLVLGSSAATFADSRMVVTLGADLTEEQQSTIMRYFGVAENQVDIIYINNEDEREHLGSYVPLEQIGTRTFSCALVAPKTSGGIQVKTANLSWVTANMIASTLSTSGVKNCQVVAASPFEVSGTGALTGVIMAYETASEVVLEPQKVELANEELVTTANLSDEIGQSKATAVINATKIEVVENSITDVTEITEIVNNVSTIYDVVISDEQSEEIAQLLARIAEQEYDITQLKATLERVQANVAGDAGADEETQKQLEEAAEQAEEAAREAAQNDDTLNDDIIVVEDGDEDESETEENILDNTDLSALEEGGSTVIEGDTTTTVQEQETEADETITIVDELDIPEENVEVIEIPEETEAIEVIEETEAVEVIEETEAVEVIEETEAVEVIEETEAVEVIEETEAVEVIEETEAVEVVEETEAVEVIEETEAVEIVEETEAQVKESDLDSADAAVYQDIKKELDQTVTQNTVSGSDGSIVYLTEEAGKKLPELVEAYALKVLVKGADAVAQEESQDSQISQNIVSETSGKAEDAHFEDQDLAQIDKYVRRLVFKDSENILAACQLEGQDEVVLYNGIMSALKAAFGVEDEETVEVIEEAAEEPVEEAAEEQAEEAVEEEAAEAVEEEFADFAEEEEIFQE